MFILERNPAWKGDCGRFPSNFTWTATEESSPHTPTKQIQTRKTIVFEENEEGG